MLAFFPFIHPPREQQCDVLWELCAGARLTVIETTETEKYVDLTFLLPEARMTQLQHGWGESMLIKKKIHVNHQTNANWQWFSPCVIVNCVLTALHVNIRLSSQPLQPRNITIKPRPVTLIQAGALTGAFKGFTKLYYCVLGLSVLQQQFTAAVCVPGTPQTPHTPHPATGHALCSMRGSLLGFLTHTITTWQGNPGTNSQKYKCALNSLCIAPKALG